MASTGETPTGETTASSDEADRVVLAYAPATEWVGEQLTGETYAGFLRRTRDGPAAAGDVWEEFVSRGCGAPRDVTLRVEAVRAGPTSATTPRSTSGRSRLNE